MTDREERDEYYNDLYTYEAMCERDEEEDEYDEYDANGFRDEEDFWRWKGY